jgi:peptidoglycan/LPS O-acetylase OafA/YrhL
MCHTCLTASAFSENQGVRKMFEEKISFQLIMKGDFSVDSFFFISGLLLTFNYLRANAKQELKNFSRSSDFMTAINHFMTLIFYRFSRFILPYMLVLAVNQVMTKYYSHNSVFELYFADHVCFFYL